MNEVATETSKHHKKIIGSKGNLSHAFQITPKGDRRILFHITMCVLRCTDSLYKVPIKKLEAPPPPPVIIHLERNDKNKQPINDLDAILYQNHIYSEVLGKSYSVNEKNESVE